MTASITKKVIIFSALLATTACGKKTSHNKAPTQPVPDAPKLVNISGNVDKDFIGGWTTNCQPWGRGSQRLSYVFEKGGLTITQRVDLTHSRCEDPVLETNYRFQVRQTAWSKTKFLTRDLDLSLEQVITRPSSEQLTRLLNQDFQCGWEDWKTDVPRDITDTSCLGIEGYELPMNLTHKTPFGVEAENLGNNLILRMTVPDGSQPELLNTLFASDRQLVVDDGRNLGVKFWNNESPEQAPLEFQSTLKWDGLTAMAGTGSFYVTDRYLASSATNVTVKDGIMTFQLQVPPTFGTEAVKVTNGSFQDAASKRYINFIFDSTSSVYEFSYYENGQKVVLGSVSTPQVVMQVSTPFETDTEAPSLTILNVPTEVEANKPFEIRYKVTDDKSGFRYLELVSKIKYQGKDSLAVNAYGETVYEGSGIYRTTYTLTNATDFSYQLLSSVTATDRVGHKSTPTALNVPVK